MNNSSMIISQALLKYGYSNFSLEILEYCEVSELLTKENYYFELLKPEYNILKEAGSSLGKKHSDETKFKISASQIGKKISKEVRARISSSLLGRKFSDETLAKMSVSQKGHKGAAQPNAIQIEVTDLETNTSTSYASINEAAKALNCPSASIRRNLNSISQKPYKGRYAFKKLL